jgi:hypothetical protein
MTIADALSDAKDEIAEYQASGDYKELETEIAAVVLTIDWLLEWLEAGTLHDAWALKRAPRPDREQLLVALQRHFDAAPPKAGNDAPAG